MEIEDQPPPIPNQGKPVWDLVVADMQERDRVGRERYGTPLQTGNGRDALVDAYQEALDQAVYLRQAIEERWRERAMYAEAEIERLQELTAGFAERIAQQSDLLSRRAESPNVLDAVLLEREACALVLERLATLGDRVVGLDDAGPDALRCAAQIIREGRQYREPKPALPESPSARAARKDERARCLAEVKRTVRYEAWDGVTRERQSRAEEIVERIESMLYQ